MWTSLPEFSSEAGAVSLTQSGIDGQEKPSLNSHGCSLRHGGKMLPSGVLGTGCSDGFIRPERGTKALTGEL